MGVPAFFRWLTIRYPKVVIDALSLEDLLKLEEEFALIRDKPTGDPNEMSLEDEGLQEAARQNLVDKTRKDLEQKVAKNNPVIDNLYLDMNGIIHPCAHPQGKPQPKSEAEIFANIFEYINKVIRIVRPQKLIYFAIDGVAPRAKMNQQRARRFRAAQEAEEDALRQASIKAEWADRVQFDDETKAGSDFKFDSNVITPGTEFMHRLSIAIKSFIIERQAEADPMWKNLVLIFSDAFVPGEGEHKILDFIRSQRAQENYDPNQSHCIYGADADLIMLGLSTHELHFFVLREAVMEQSRVTCHKCGQQGHKSFECGTEKAKNQQIASSVEFQFVKISVVREYLSLEFRNIELPFRYDFERIVDDFVFLCFLVGNDFLPHLPSLHIREGALDAILVIYKNILPKLGDYLTNEGKVNFRNCDRIFRDISKLEEEQFKIMYEKQKREKEYQQRQKERYNPSGSSAQNRDETSSTAVTQTQANVQAKEKLQREMERADISATEKKKIAKTIVSQEAKRIADAKQQAKVEAYQDRVMLHVEGWKMRYYTNKFLVTDPADVSEFISNIRQSYIEGLQWVFSYYYKGCESWDWYYPYHYAPFASDLTECEDVQVTFSIGQPRRPFEQLMCVFPKQSAHALPSCYHWLMSESHSPIIDFYPTQFRLDVNGAARAWMGVILLPFIDQDRLFKAMEMVDEGQTKLTESERHRNKRYGEILLFFKPDCRQVLAQKVQVGEEYQAQFSTQNQLAGKVKGTTFKALNVDKPELTSVQVYEYLHPHYDRHLCSLQAGATHPPHEVDPYEITQTNRHYFNGENAIRLAEQVLNLPPMEFRSQYRTGYKNCHATHEEPPRKRPYPTDGFHEQPNQEAMKRQRYGDDRDYQQRPQPPARSQQFEHHNMAQHHLLQHGGFNPQTMHPYQLYHFETFKHHQQQQQSQNYAAPYQPRQQSFHQQPSYGYQQHQGYGAPHQPQQQKWSLNEFIQAQNQQHRQPQPAPYQNPYTTNNRFSDINRK